MAINKVVFGEDTLIDLTDTTAEETDVANGKIFHKKDGTTGTGTAIISNYNCEIDIISTSFVNNVTKIGHISTELTNINNLFSNMMNLEEVESIDMPNVTNISGLFSGCSKLTKPPVLDTSNVTNMRYLFQNCLLLEDIPLYDTNKIGDIRNMVTGCTKLTDESLYNILQMCINIRSYGRTKTLVSVGLDSTNYPASRIQALSNYQAFINAGWSIGY